MSAETLTKTAGGSIGDAAGPETAAAARHETAADVASPVERDAAGAPLRRGDGPGPIIELDDVHVTFRTRTAGKSVRAVRGVSLRLMPGETIGIVGESGCGKSTTANVMCGLQKPTAGRVYFQGREVTKRTAEDRRAIGRVISVVFQDPATALNARMAVRDQLADPLHVHKVGTKQERQARVRELISLVGLPTSALDVSVRAQILNLLTDLKDELGLAMVFISHDIQTVRYVSDRIVVMNGGQIVEEGPAAALLADPQDPYTRKLLSAAPSLLHPSVPDDFASADQESRNTAKEESTWQPTPTSAE